MIVTSRKIRRFNESIAQLKKLNATENIAQLEKTPYELVADFDRLKKQMHAFERINEL